MNFMDYGLAVVYVGAVFTGNKELSKSQLLGMGASVAVGIDALITPALTGGTTLHQIVLESTGGQPLSQLYEEPLVMMEQATAWIPQVWKLYTQLPFKNSYNQPSDPHSHS